MDWQARIVARFLELEDTGTTTLASTVRELPAETYTSVERFEREQSALFRRAPVVVCTAIDIPLPGDFLTCESGGVPIVVVRAADRLVRAYLNVCRHRAHPLATGCGHAGRFVCPFHAWSYDTGTGSLLAQPRSMGGFDATDPSDFGLIALPCAESHGLVIVRPEGDEQIDADAFLSGIGITLDPFELGQYHVFSRETQEWACNWKLLVDTFLESYHVAALHGGSLGNVPGHRMWFESFGVHARIPVPGPTLYEQRSMPEHDRRLVGHATVQHHLFPNVFFNHVFDYFVLWRFVPTAVDRTLAMLTRYWPTPIDGELRAKLDRRFAWQAKLTVEEDYPASVAIQRSLASGRVKRAVAGRNEAAMQNFHKSIDQMLESDS